MDKSKYIEYAMGINNSYKYVENLDGKTKAQLKTFATSIGLSISTSLTKAEMIEAIKDTNEFYRHNVKEGESRKNAFEKSFYERYPNGYSA